MENNQDPKAEQEILLYTEESLFETLFADAEKPAEPLKPEEVKLLQQKGFQIATITETNICDELAVQIAALENGKNSTDIEWGTLYQAFRQGLELRMDSIKLRMEALKLTESAHDEKLKELADRKVAIYAEIEAEKANLLKVRQAFSLSKKGIGEKLVIDVEQELTRFLQLQKLIYNETKEINEDKFKNTKSSLDKLIERLVHLRKTFLERFDLLQERAKSLSDDGINATVAYTLMAIGSAMAGVAGYFFAIFSAKSNYSSQDALYYLLTNILHASRGSEYPIYMKCIFLLAGLLVITGFSWLIDKAINRKTFFSKPRKGEEEDYSFVSNLKMEGFEYNYNTKSKSWLLLWLRICPFLLVTGIAIILMSHNSEIISDTNSLSASTEGLLIGTILAMGLAAVIYIYIVKVVERRTAKHDTVGLIRKNWELVVALLLFITVVLVFILYRDDSVIKNFPASPFSIIGFFGASIITAFAFAYGLRYFGLIESLSQIENLILYVDRAIRNHSVPKQVSLYVDYEQNLKALMDCLVNNLEKKSQLLENANQKDAKVHITERRGSGNLWDSVIKIVRPSGTKNNFEEVELFEILEWEIEYFPEHAEQIKIIGSIYKDKKRQLDDIETKIQELESQKKKSIQEIRDEVSKLESIHRKTFALQIRSDMARLQKEKKQSSILDTCIVHIKDGFQLGILYKATRMESEIIHYN